MCCYTDHSSCASLEHFWATTIHATALTLQAIRSFLDGGQISLEIAVLTANARISPWGIWSAW